MPSMSPSLASMNTRSGFNSGDLPERVAPVQEARGGVRRPARLSRAASKSRW